VFRTETLAAVHPTWHLIPSVFWVSLRGGTRDDFRTFPMWLGTGYTVGSLVFPPSPWASHYPPNDVSSHIYQPSMGCGREKGELSQSYPRRDVPLTPVNTATY